jgi:hypothetical protein
VSEGLPLSTETSESVYGEVGCVGDHSGCLYLLDCLAVVLFIGTGYRYWLSFDLAGSSIESTMPWNGSIYTLIYLIRKHCTPPVPSIEVG